MFRAVLCGLRLLGRSGRDLCQPLFALRHCQQMLATGLAMHRAEVDGLHEVVAFGAAVEHLRAFGRRPLHFGEGHMQGAVS
ncbi:hypothetical protein PS676_05962 [Pseudomonas fluorescens]|nr:hypothetical protein PS676_05962 [Pseudomonas fluorescens]